jgi:hypothetical protein
VNNAPNTYEKLQQTNFQFLKKRIKSLLPCKKNSPVEKKSFQNRAPKKQEASSLLLFF